MIRKVAALLKDVPGITVSGHTDNVATEDELFQSNWELSSQRAVAVAHQMIKVPGFLTAIVWWCKGWRIPSRWCPTTARRIGA